MDSPVQAPSFAGWRLADERLRRDLALAIRALRRTPGFTAAAIAILGLGIGMSTAMFAIYRAVLVDRLPVVEQERLVVMHPLDGGGAHLDVPYAYLKQFRADSATIRSVAGVYHMGALTTPLLDGDASLTVAVATVSPNFFDVLGTRPALGRFLRAADGEAGAPIVAVLTFQSWHRLFHEDARIIGRAFTRPYDRARVTIVGVAPPGLEYPAGVDAWFAAGPDFVAQVDVVARLAAGVTPDAAGAQFDALLQRLNPFADEKLPDVPRIAGVETRPFTQEILGGTRPALVALTLAVALLLVIACVNVGNLVLLRTAGRGREIAVRRAIGASVGDVVHQLVVENAVIGLAGGVVGLGCAAGLLRVLLALAPRELPRTDVIRVGGAPLGAAISVTLLAVLLFGLFPSLVAARAAPYTVLRADTRSGSGGGARRRVRRWLVSAQMALAVVMLAGAALLTKSLDRLQHMRLGFTPEHLALLSFTGPQSLFSTQEKGAEVADVLTRRLRAVPGVTAVTPVESPPFKGQTFFIMKMAPAERSAEERARNPFIPFDVAGADYFSAFRIPILRGRGFLETDTPGAQQVVVLSEALAKRFWPNEDAVGKRLRNAYDTSGTLYTVVGVAGDTRFRTLRDVAPVIYVPFHQMLGTWWNGFLAVRTRGSLETALPSIRGAVRDVNPAIVLWDVKTMDQLLAAPLAQPRLSAVLLSSFSLVALVLAAIGLYGVMSSLVRQQTRDIGVRLALGATTRDVRRLVLGEAMRVVGIGAVAGLAGAIMGMRMLAALLFDVQPADPASLAAAAVLLVAIGLVAAYLPARRAARVDPARALRTE